jgi:hypothetical protein
MTRERRLKRFLVGPDDLRELLCGTASVVASPLPEDAMLVDFGKDGDRQSLYVIVYSSTYDPVPVGTSMPLSANGPVIGKVAP